MTNTVKNFIVGAAAITVCCTATYLVWQWDERVMATIHRGGYEYDTTAFRPTEAEQRTAKQFADSILPQLKHLGLVISYTRTEIETIITVSGTVWKARSQFFKEQFLEQIVVYNKVNGFSVRTKIIDKDDGTLYAELTSPDRRAIYF